MRLTKVQKFLKENNIDYEYYEGWGCGEVNFTYKDEKYLIGEHVGNGGNTVQGILTDISYMGTYITGLREAGTQKEVIRRLKLLLESEE